MYLCILKRKNLSNCEKSGGASRSTIVHGRADRILRALARFLKIIKFGGPEQIIDDDRHGSKKKRGSGLTALTIFLDFIENDPWGSS